MPSRRKATDEQLTTAYEELGSVWAVAKRFGMCGQSVHERLMRLGATKPNNYFTKEEDERIRREYVIYRDQNQLSVLAESMGRSRSTICAYAKRLGLTDMRYPRAFGVWHTMSEDAARLLFEKFKKSRLGFNQFCDRFGYGRNGFHRTMRKYFPDEWEHVIELKQPKGTWYRIGRYLEYSVRDHLTKLGYLAQRSPASKAIVDVTAIKAGTVLLIQCKRSGNIGINEWNELLTLAKSVAAVPIVARTTGRKLVFYRLLEPKDGSRRRQPWEVYDVATNTGSDPAAPKTDE